MLDDISAEELRATHVLEFDYTRSVGPVLGRFFTTLRDERKFLGSRTSDGRVIVPPQEYDPQTGEALTEMVEVGPEGRVVSWCWVTRPRASQPLDRPFAYALIRLEGADAPLLHAVDAGDAQRMHIGARVRPRWAPERRGSICDVTCFELEESR